MRDFWQIIWGVIYTIGQFVIGGPVVMFYMALHESAKTIDMVVARYSGGRKAYRTDDPSEPTVFNMLVMAPLSHFLHWCLAAAGALILLGFIYGLLAKVRIAPDFSEIDVPASAILLPPVLAIPLALWAVSMFKALVIVEYTRRRELSRRQRLELVALGLYTVLLAGGVGGGCIIAAAMAMHEYGSGP